MKSFKKYICIAAVALLATAGITGCGWWKNAAEQVKESNVSSSVPATQDPLADDGDGKNDEAKKPSTESSDGTGVISVPEVLNEQDATASNEKNGADVPTGNQNSGKPEQTAAPDNQGNNSNGNKTDSAHDGNNNAGNGNNNSGNNDSGNQGNNGGNDGSGNQGNNNSDNGGSGNQGNNNGNTGSNDQGNNGDNEGSGDQGNHGDNTGTGDQGNGNGNGNDNDNGGNAGTGGSQGVELPEIPIN